MPKVMSSLRCISNRDEGDIDENLIKHNFAKHLVKDKHLHMAIDGVCWRLIHYNFGVEGIVTEYMKLNVENIRQKLEEHPLLMLC